MAFDFDALEHAMNGSVLETFGRSVVVDGVARIAEFREAGQDIGLGDVSAIANVPRIALPDEQVPAEPVGKTVIVGARRFRVADAIKDGGGLTVMYLEAQP